MNACRNTFPTSAGRSAAMSTPTSAIRKAIRAAGCDTPVVCTGGVHNFEFAEQMLADGVCDIVGSARQTLADPDWFLKTKLGLGDSVRVCEFTNYCEGPRPEAQDRDLPALGQARLDDAAGATRTADGKRRLTAPDWKPPS